jgi:glycine cleavage system aminomethyltransferase T
MMDVGLWQRPRVYKQPGETLEQAYVREARAVRTGVGITDVSTLGKIDVPTSRVQMQRPSSTASTPTPSRRFPSARRATG